VSARQFDHVTHNFSSFSTVTSDKLNNNNVGTINGISLALPHYPLLPQHAHLDDSIFCNATHKPGCTRNSTTCECIHRLKVPLNAVVEFLLVDIDDHSRHPFHLHGHKFYVTEIGRFDGSVTAGEAGRVAGVSRRPLLKDTVTIPNNGYVRVKFRADNAGFWLGHCHFDYHMAVGMGFVLQVGEVGEMPNVPEGFARNCGGYMPARVRVM
jgi:hypothetical protein